MIVYRNSLPRVGKLPDHAAALQKLKGFGQQQKCGPEAAGK
ncbi:MAG: hypothetical protein JWQ88_560, partial [Rhodoferax sp.]|nr:hypothetical protein [Rhodoferax sp.]